MPRGDTSRSSCTDGCIWFLTVLVISISGLLAYSASLSVPGQAVADHGNVKASMCYMSSRVLGGLCPGFDVAQSCGDGVVHNVTANMTDVNGKLGYIIDILLTQLLPGVRSNTEDLTKLREVVANNTAASQAATDALVKETLKAEKHTAAADERLKSYNFGTFASAVAIFASAYVQSDDIRFTAGVVVPFVATHGVVLLTDAWFLICLVIVCSSVIGAIIIKLYRDCEARRAKDDIHETANFRSAMVAATAVAKIFAAEKSTKRPVAQSECAGSNPPPYSPESTYPPESNYPPESTSRVTTTLPCIPPGGMISTESDSQDASVISDE